MVEIDECPYQASVHYFLSHIWETAIISENYAVRAAHCTDGYVSSNKLLNSEHVLPIESSKWQVRDSSNEQTNIFYRALTVLFYTPCLIEFYILWTILPDYQVDWAQAAVTRLLIVY